MTGKELFKIFAPDGAKWTEWIRPVPFVAIDTYNRKPSNNWIDRNITFINKYMNDTAIFIDLQGKESIEIGIAIAKIGYRPIPVFNGTDEQEGAIATTETYLVESALINGGTRLKNINISPNANPAFLLDSLRTNRYRAVPSIFDNSWDIYGQDVPSAEYMYLNKINKIIVVGNRIQKDLKKILLKYQEKSIDIYISDGYCEPKRIVLKKTLKEKLEKEEL